MNLIDKNISDIKRICKESNVKSLFAFGSITNSNFDSNSDIDFIVEINSNNPLEYAEKYFELKENLNKLFGREIDLLDERAVRNPYLSKEINSTKKIVYE